MKKISKIILLLLVIVVICFIIDGYHRKYNLENYGKTTIGKYVSQRNYPKSQQNFFIYYVKGVKYKHDGGRTPRGFSKNIGNFYKIKYSIKYKGVIKPLFDEQVTDTTEILQAGFTKEDLKK
ncbi:hypothetical protein CHU92_12505 [Flavobacterium cyanobacteriorum]|uniref:YxeA family protein n=1 Tax=Flavobacterium cyanobacteriorum TaxID=2022802 RepID=A0A255YXE1_9FLAO|nr:hypothetical protein [Flavobacterium cyanobacteriorum]OYQ33903.1 hypothetical protein CHU92_12505 [Flavobacterium cyanobacteriorum]